ncbi:MAG TPA: hypothetical protein VFE40_16070 [Jatrophihabitantaceae bacterium]|nr:hypothetical protein [Jatrophihabitantaceae bacterium]
MVDWAGHAGQSTSYRYRLMAVLIARDRIFDRPKEQAGSRDPSGKLAGARAARGSSREALRASAHRVWLAMRRITQWDVAGTWPDDFARFER